jgi:hypothetical protein
MQTRSALSRFAWRHQIRRLLYRGAAPVGGPADGVAPHRDRLLEPLSQRVRRLLRRLLEAGDDLLVPRRSDGEAVLAERPLGLGRAYRAPETTQDAGAPGGAALQAPAQLKRAVWFRSAALPRLGLTIGHGVSSLSRCG